MKPSLGGPERGQSSIELLAVLPLGLLVVLAVAQLLAAGLCREHAAHAARAGAVALLQGTDAGRTARAALPARSRRQAKISVAGRRVVVRLRPPAVLPGLAALLTYESSADAGPPA